MKHDIADSAFFRRRPIFSCLLTACFFIFAIPCTANAKLMRVTDDTLSGICGNGGFSMAVKDVQIFGFIKTFHYCASDGGYLELNNIKLNDGSGGPMKFNFDYPASPTKSGIIYFDVFESDVASVDKWDGSAPTTITRGMFSLIAPDWDQDTTFSIGNFLFSDSTNTYDLGQLELGPFDLSSFAWYISPRINGSGVDWEHDFQMTIDQAAYAYQINPPACKKLMFDNIYIGSSFADYAGDDPSDTTTWKPNNGVDFGEFKIGDLFGDVTNGVASDPAMFDVGEGDIYGTGTIYGAMDFRLSMQGSFRFEKAEYGGIDFGPGAIDGLHVYRMEAMLIP